MKYVVMVRCEFKTELGWDYLWNEHSGVRHTSRKKAEKELKVASIHYDSYIKEEA